LKGQKNGRGNRRGNKRRVARKAGKKFATAVLGRGNDDMVGKRTKARTTKPKTKSLGGVKSPGESGDIGGGPFRLGGDDITPQPSRYWIKVKNPDPRGTRQLRQRRIDAPRISLFVHKAEKCLR